MIVSIIVPTYNEHGIELRLAQLLNFLQKNQQIKHSSDPSCSESTQIITNDLVFEILIADDSDERFRRSLKSYCMAHANQNVEFIDGENTGKGSALIKACRRSRGDIVFFIDADFVIPLEYIHEFCLMIAKGNDAIIGERPAKRNLLNPVRLLLSTGLLFFQRFFIFQSFDFKDTQCGFKAFKGDLIRTLAPLVKVSGGMIDIEVLYILRKNLKKIQGVHVNLIRETRPTRIKLTRCLFLDPFDLVAIKWRGITRQYQLK